jgi:hypothetical protein
MFRVRLQRFSVAAFFSLLVLAAPAQSDPARAASLRSGDYIRADVRGQFRKAAVAGAEHTGFQITAGGVTWEVDVSAKRKLVQTAEALDGRAAIATGTYAERAGVSGTRRILTITRLEPDTSQARRQSIDVTLRGTLKSGVMAIGAETTGTTITSGAVTWELALKGAQRETARKLDGRKVSVSGRLERRAGVEIESRFIVRVRSLESAR